LLFWTCTIQFSKPWRQLLATSTENFHSISIFFLVFFVHQKVFLWLFLALCLDNLPSTFAKKKISPCETLNNIKKEVFQKKFPANYSSGSVEYCYDNPDETRKLLPEVRIFFAKSRFLNFFFRKKIPVILLWMCRK